VHDARAGARRLGTGLVAAALGVAAWAIPTACAVGASRWFELSRAQAAGHAIGWGEPAGGSSWIGTFDAVALQLGGVEGHVAAFVAFAGMVAACVVLARSRPRALWVAAVALPVGLALAALQPIDAAPRHALPVTFAALVLAALALET